MDKYIGKLLDNRYEVLEVAGVGGMATIYKARCHVLNRFVAIKILKDEYAQDEEIRRRFYMESQAVAKLSHPNIVAVYDVSHTEGLDYIVMELIEGVTLKEYLQRKGHLSWQETLFFAQQIARALSHAHSRGVIHQDIKPQNVLITNEGQAKVTDFGIASFAANQETRIVQEAIGSVHYISPEQAKGSTVDYRTDLYSLGVVMYEMLTGKLPFEGETALSIVMQHINAMPLMPSEVVAGIPKGINQIVMHAMCPTVSRRYHSADELYSDLQKVKNDPSITFDYECEIVRGEAPALDETQAIPNVHEVRHQAAEQYRAQKPAQQDSYAPRPQQRKKTAVAEKEGPSSTTVAVIAVVVFAVIAMVIAGLLMFSGGAGKNKVEVPNFVGLNYQENIEGQAKYADFVFSVTERVDATQPNGTVLEQDTKEGSKVTKGSTIGLVVCIGNDEKQQNQEYTVENFEGQTREQAETTLRGLELKIDYRFEEKTSDTVEQGKIIETNPAAGEKMTDKDTLVLYVSSGKDTENTSKMPNVVGQPISEAKKILDAYDIKIAKQSKVASDQREGTVVSQSIDEGQEVEAGKGVSLEISSGIAPNKPEDTTGNDNAGTTPSGGAATSASRTITVSIPEDQQASAHIVVKFDDGTVAYDKTTTGQASVDVSLTGTGTRYVTVFINDQQIGSQEVNFS